MDIPRSLRRLMMIIAGAAPIALATSAVAQQGVNPIGPEIVTSGTADVLIPPTKASFLIGIRTLAPSAAVASADNARLSKAVSEGLQAAALSREELAGSRLNVGPTWAHDVPSRRRKRTGFEAANTIRIETDHLERVGLYLDAALTAGATEVSDISFSAKNSESARRQALAEAVAAARTDAEAMAKAGGGALGELTLLSTEPTNMQSGVSVEEIIVTAAKAPPPPVGTTVTPTQIRVTARVVARWRFVSPAALH